MTTEKIAFAIGRISFFVLWGYICWGLIQQNWPQVTAFAALLCAINSTRVKK